MSADQVGPRLAESLLLHADKGQGLLLRLYHLNRELRDPSSDLYFLHDKLFLAATKHVASGAVKPGSSVFSVGAANAKVAEEITKMSSKIRDLRNHFGAQI